MVAGSRIETNIMMNDTRNNGQVARADVGDGELLRVRNLKTYFYTSDGVVPAVDGIDLTIKRGQTVGLVGESGCGKSVTSLSIMRLVAPPGRIVKGSEIDLGGTNLVKVSEEKMY